MGDWKVDGKRRWEERGMGRVGDWMTKRWRRGREKEKRGWKGGGARVRRDP